MGEFMKRRKFLGFLSATGGVVLTGCSMNEPVQISDLSQVKDAICLHMPAAHRLKWKLTRAMLKVLRSYARHLALHVEFSMASE